MKRLLGLALALLSFSGVYAVAAESADDEWFGTEAISTHGVHREDGQRAGPVFERSSISAKKFHGTLTGGTLDLTAGADAILRGEGMAAGSRRRMGRKPCSWSIRRGLRCCGRERGEGKSIDRAGAEAWRGKAGCGRLISELKKAMQP